MSYFKKLISHYSTISRHRRLVRKLCFKCGLYKQGFLHDLSKYSPVEFFAGVKYYQGYRSPIDAEKEDLGYSLGWLHHKGRNRHHWEYWVDRDMNNKNVLNVNQMPLNYLIEAACDKIAASKIYQKDKYKDSSAYDYLTKGDVNIMGKENAYRHMHLLGYLKDNGEEKALNYYKSLYKKWKKDKKTNI